MHDPILVTAISGWADAQEGATRSLRYLVRKLPAQRFARIEPEEFYIFTRNRPFVRVDSEGQRTIRWPQNNFSFWHDDKKGRDFIFFSGVEPNLKWQTYTNALLEVARSFGVSEILVLGSLIDDTPHTREPRITGSASQSKLTRLFEELGVKHRSGYQGPISLSSVLLETSASQQFESASLWAHCPHYLQTSPNPKVTHALLWRLIKVLDLDLDLEDMAGAASSFVSDVNSALANNSDASNYVRQLEERYDRAIGAISRPPQEELPSSDIVIQDLEEFLRTRQHRDDGIGPNSPSDGPES